MSKNLKWILGIGALVAVFYFFVKGRRPSQTLPTASTGSAGPFQSIYDGWRTIAQRGATSPDRVGSIISGVSTITKSLPDLFKAFQKSPSETASSPSSYPTAALSPDTYWVDGFNALDTNFDYGTGNNGGGGYDFYNDYWV